MRACSSATARRTQWAAAVNTKFEEKGLDVRIDHRSYVRQGLDLIPTVHEGAMSGRQVSDVQQEINGLMDIERNFKIDPEVIREINERKVGYWRSFM